MMPHLSSVQSDLLHKGVSRLGLALPGSAFQAIETHLAQVQKWRSKINLMAYCDESALISHHALDCLAIVPLLIQSQSVIDIGSGAGFPGMMLAAALPDVSFTLLDSRQRRIEFLRLCNVSAGLGNVSFVAIRVGDYHNTQKGALSVKGEVYNAFKIDTLVVRAVTSLAQLIEMTAHLRYPGQRLIAMKGQYPHAELAQINRSKGDGVDKIDSISVERLNVPFLDAKRHAVIIQFK